ncbi:MAG: nucleotidyltransferase domain-containing protein [Pseudomonadota bacterium]|jgi:predicted nucleotidyltransferase|nr:nucleotidyltransferase domain-containing protein [Pseudomonadota bacterium]
MRLTERQVQDIKAIIRAEVGAKASVIVFGSRTDDSKKGGDLDLLVQVPTPVERPALVSAKLSTRISDIMHGLKVDVILQSPATKTAPIHRIARETGIQI